MWRCEDSRLAHRPREKLLVIAQLAEHSTVVVRLPSSIERSLVRFRLSRLAEGVVAPAGAGKGRSARRRPGFESRTGKEARQSVTAPFASQSSLV